MLQSEWLGEWAIWGAGRDGRQFFRALRKECRARVKAFYDVDPKKIGTEIDGVPVVSREEMSMVETPVAVCVALDRDDWANSVEDAIQQIRESSQNKDAPIEGKHYYHIV